MRILMFGWEFPPHISGGLGTACYGMTRGLSTEGHEVLFVVPKAYGDENQKYVKIFNASDVEISGTTIRDHSLYEKIKFIMINSNIVPYVSPEEFATYHEEWARTGGVRSEDPWRQRFDFSGKYGPNLMEEVARYAEVAAEVTRELDGQFDVIHAHDWLTYYAGIAAKHISGKPLVVQVHATEFDRGKGSTTSEIYQIERAGMEAADVVITVSNLTKHIVEEKYHIDPSKVFTVYNAVTFERTSSEIIPKGVEDRIVTFLGRITYQKGPEYFVEVAKKILTTNKNVRFVMAGNGDLLNNMVRKVAKEKIAHKFHFTGFLNQQEVQYMLSISDVYIMPSISEPFGISPLEAMYSRVPTIISKQSGVAEILRNAIKVDYWDVDATADAINAILNYPALGDQLTEDGYTEVTNLKWTTVAKKLETVYRTAIEKCSTK